MIKLGYDWFKDFEVIANECYEKIFKPFVIFIWGGVITLTAPIQHILLAIALAWIFNFWNGLRTDITTNNTHFNIDKAWKSINQIISLGISAFIVYYLPVILRSEIYAEKGVRMLAWIACWSYMTNGFRNLSLRYPTVLFYSIMYELLSTRALSKIYAFLGIKSSKNDSNII